MAIFDKPTKPDFVGKIIDYEDDVIILPRPTLGVPVRYKGNKRLGAQNKSINDYDIPAFLRKPDDKK